MQKIVAIVLISLLGFLGCSDSNDGTTTVGEAIPVAPFGIIDTPTPTYEWTPVQGVTKYRLVVQDTNEASTIQDAQETYIIDEWYTAEKSGCASEDGLCMATPDIEVFEENTWKVQACANTNCGQWSESLNFDFTAMNVPRFTDNGDGTVTDIKTMLMWFKDASVLKEYMYMEAVNACTMYPIWSFAGYDDWRLPSMPELRSLIDTSQSDPALPPGNPFINVQSYYYWTTLALGTGYHHVVYMPNGSVGGYAYDYDELSGWPVRSGN